MLAHDARTHARLGMHGVRRVWRLVRTYVCTTVNAATHDAHTNVRMNVCVSMYNEYVASVCAAGRCVYVLCACT